MVAVQRRIIKHHQKQPLWRWLYSFVVSSILLFHHSTTTSLTLAPPPTRTSSPSRSRFSIQRQCGRSRHVSPQLQYQSFVEDDRQRNSKTALFVFPSYGRGAEIWPECNEIPIQLSESFPGGKIPDAALKLLQKRQRQQSSTTSSNASLLRKVVDSATTTERMIATVAAALLIGGFVPTVDIFLAMGWSTYLWFLHRLAQAPRRRQNQQQQQTNGSMDAPNGSIAAAPNGSIAAAPNGSKAPLNGSMAVTTTVPNLPALPPQGHIPTSVSNPLGYEWAKSKRYQQWLAAGVILGLWGPILLMARYSLLTAIPNKRLYATAARAVCARPLFWLCCQALTEAVTRNLVTPLPIRILVPVSYHALRLGPLWAWATSPIALTGIGRLIAVANWLYWTTNLLGFLLPVATLRYLRAHFFAVEAERVYLRETLDEGIL